MYGVALTSAQLILWIASLGSSRLAIKALLRLRSCSRAPGCLSVKAAPVFCSCARMASGDGEDMILGGG